MANVLSKDKQISITAALAEGSSIRSIERMTGVHRDTIMRLGVRIGQGCAKVLDAKMRGLDCKRLELDEIWGYIGKKMRHVQEGDDPQLGDVWTYCAIDADTKLVPAFHVSSTRDHENTNAFLRDLASRLNNRVQISTDAMNAYEEAIEFAFGSEVDYAQIVKSYASEDGKYNPERKYSPTRITSSHKNWIMGSPDPSLVSTSYVERLNASTRLHVKRLGRLTLAFSKKKENFEAAVALHFASYNLVKTHRTLKMTPAMAAGVERDFWSYGDLFEAANG
jgi:IS1 family transposase